MTRVMIVIPAKPGMHPMLKSRSLDCLREALLYNPGLQLAATLDYEPEPARPGDSTPWSRVTRVRNRLLHSINVERYDYLLWIDSDVVQYPSIMPTLLVAAANGGVAAPMVLVEESNIFYDWAAFVIAGQSLTAPNERGHNEERGVRVGRQLSQQFPYWPGTPNEVIVPMDCVGTITLVHTDIYRAGVVYEDHPAFTDHFPICQQARALGRPVCVRRDCVAYHADLPRYGEDWH